MMPEPFPIGAMQPDPLAFPSVDMMVGANLRSYPGRLNVGYQALCPTGLLDCIGGGCEGLLFTHICILRGKESKALC